MTFGGYIRKQRTLRGMGLREMGRQIGISSAYMSDIEKDKRAAPSKDVIEKIGHLLELNSEYLFDLAGINANRIPLDLPEIIMKRPVISNLIRTIDRHGLNKEEILDYANRIGKERIKAIIVAAGIGSRMGKMTHAKPKCMLQLGRKTLLQRQVEALKHNGIDDISVVVGYKREKINYKELKYYVNDDYNNNNILYSLFCAEKEMDGEVIISYSDILYEKEVVERLLRSSNDISIVVDVEWKNKYLSRSDRPIEEAENVIVNADNKIETIGKILTKKHDVHGEFIGMMKLTRRGADIFKRHFHRARELFSGKPFQRAKTFEKAYLTDLLQDMLDLGVDVHAVIIDRGWKEIDTVEDYKNAIKLFNNGGHL